MKTAIAITAVIVGLASAGYSWHLRSQPQLPYFEPHRMIKRDGQDCAVWRVEQFYVLLCDNGVGVIYPKQKSGYSS